MWSPSSTDLNPLDFSIWDTLERETNRTSQPNVDSPKSSIVDASDNLSEEFVINSCVAFK
uniref:Uncharacterized protein n=1 Tax=Lepeophtheirus salmonis TaxID=72036 RepID=A0A0K2VJZ3_LEPSM